MDRMRRIELLVRAAEAGSFARAARFLQVDPSAVSHAIAELERELKTTLFYRTTRQLRLTEEGEEIYRHGCNILRELGELESAASKAPERLTGILRVGLGVTGPHIIMPRLPEFLRRHPGLQIDCLLITRIKEMHESGVDLLLHPGEPPESGVIARKLVQGRLGIYAAPKYLETAGEPVSPEDLLWHRCLIAKPAFFNLPRDEWEFERKGERKVVKVPRTLMTNDREGLIAAALAGGGLMRIGMFNPALITSGRLRKVLADWTCLNSYSLYAIYRKTARTPPKIAAFLQFLTETFAAFDPEELTLIHSPNVGDSLAKAQAKSSGTPRPRLDADRTGRRANRTMGGK
jgi:LysR family transcriptional regulator, transcriptional activator for dmlA